MDNQVFSSPIESARSLDYSVDQMRVLAQQVRRDIIRMVYYAQSGHPGGSLGCVEYFVSLFGSLMRHRPQQFVMEGNNEDIFILSNGHISPVFYSVLARTGYFGVEELNTFRKINSRLQGHPATAEGLPGIRVATGSLGQGVSVALGIALGKKLNNDPYLVFCLCGDGEMQEGQIWEAANFAAHHKIDNFILTVDLNYKQIDGDTRSVMNTESLQAKMDAFNWMTFVIENGNQLESVLAGLKHAKSRTGQGKPIAVFLKTEMGFGVDFMQGTHHWHGKAPNTTEYERALNQLPETLLGDF